MEFVKIFYTQLAWLEIRLPLSVNLLYKYLETNVMMTINSKVILSV